MIKKDFKADWKEMRELSDLSLKAPLSNEQYERMMALAKRLNIGGGKIPRGL